MHKLLKLYDCSFGFVIGVATTLLVEGRGNAALAAAMAALALRFIGRAELEQGDRP